MKFLYNTVVYLNKKGEKKTTGEIMSGILMIAIFMLFLPLIIVLLRNRFTAHLSLPREFGISTLVLISATWLLHYMKQYKESDQYKKLRKMAAAQLMLATLFLLVQFIGSVKIFSLALYKDVRVIALIAVYHGLHFFVAIGMLVNVLLRTRFIHSPADWYIYFLNPKPNATFRYNCLLWNYLCVMWVGLYLVMLLKFG
jgi:hypothetical protein